jgi:hypothetical protein
MITQKALARRTQQVKRLNIKEGTLTTAAVAKFRARASHIAIIGPTKAVSAHSAFSCRRATANAKNVH